MLRFPSGMSRRGFCLCCVASSTFSATGWLTPSRAFAQARGIVETIRSEAADARIAVHRLRGNVSVLEGSGGNIAVLTGPDGKLLVDAGIGVSKPRIVEALASLDAVPVRRLINTHWHFDHTDGNAWLHDEGAFIIAHENTRKHLLSAQRVEDWSFDFPPSSAAAIPSQVVGLQSSMTVNGITLDLKHYPNAHTDSDITIYFVENDILHAGDIYWNSVYPFIDYSTGGSIDGMIQAVEALLHETSERTIIVPGHGAPVSNRSELQSYHDMLVAVRQNVVNLKRQGKSLNEVVASRPTAAYDEVWGQFVTTPAAFTKLVYEGV